MKFIKTLTIAACAAAFLLSMSGAMVAESRVEQYVTGNGNQRGYAGVTCSTASVSR